MFFSPDQALGWISLYGYAVVFPISVFEGPVITMIAGLLASSGILNIYFSFFLVVLGDVVGDLIHYSIGRWGKDRLLAKFEKWEMVNPAKVESFAQAMRDHSAKTLLFGKFTQAFGTPILMAAGLARIPLGRFIWYNLAGTIPKSILFLAIGFYFGQTYLVVNDYINGISAVMMILVILTISVLFIYSRARRH